MQSDKHWGVYLNEFCCRFPLNETPVKFIKSWGLTEKLRLKASVHKRSKIKFVIILQIYHEYYSWQKWIYSVLQEAVYYARLFACKRSGLRFTRSTFAFPSIISVVTKILKKTYESYCKLRDASRKKCHAANPRSARIKHSGVQNQ